jgi:hypothetical protein
MNINARTVSMLVALAVAGASHAQAPTKAQQPVDQDAPKINFVAVDKNADGSLSKTEVLSIATLDAAFAQLDADRDEALSPAEFSRWSQAGKSTVAKPKDPATAPSGSAGAQHMPDSR